MGIYRAQIAKIIISPHSIQDIFTGNRNVLIVFEVNEQFIFLRRQIDRLSGDTHLTANFIDRQLARLIHALAALMAALFNGAHPRRQHNRRKRLGDIIICTEVKAEHLVIFLRACRQHHNRYLRVFAADMAQNTPAIVHRHHHVQYNQVNGTQLLVNQLHSLPAVCRLQDSISIAAQKIRNQTTDSFFIICYQNCEHMACSSLNTQVIFLYYVSCVNTV